MKKIILSLILVGCGNVGQQCNTGATCSIAPPVIPAAAPASSSPDAPTIIAVESPSPSPTPEPPKLVSEWRCHATTYGGTVNGVIVQYDLKKYDDLTEVGTASVGSETGEQRFEVGDPEGVAGVVRVPWGTDSSYWHVYIDKSALVLSAYLYNGNGDRVHWQSWLACEEL